MLARYATAACNAFLGYSKPACIEALKNTMSRAHSLIVQIETMHERAAKTAEEDAARLTDEIIRDDLNSEVIL